MYIHTSVWEGRKEVLDMGKHHYDFVLPEETMKGLQLFIVNKQGDCKER